MEEDKKYKYLFKVVLIGDASVGKTCLVRRYAKGFFVGSPGATIGVDFMMKNVNTDGETVKVSRELTVLSLSCLIINIDTRLSCQVFHLKYQRLYHSKYFKNQMKPSMTCITVGFL